MIDLERARWHIGQAEEELEKAKRVFASINLCAVYLASASAHADISMAITNVLLVDPAEGLDYIGDLLPAPRE